MTQVVQQPVFLVLRFIFAFLAIFGNIFIIVTIQRYKKLRSKSYNGLICLLAFSDVIVGIGLLIRAIATIVHILEERHDYTPMHCVSIGATNIFGIHLSQLSMLCIAFDRLYAIMSPIGYKHRDPYSYPLKCLIFCVIFSCMGLFFLYLGVENDHIAKVCNIGDSRPNGIFVRYWTIFFTVVTILLFGAYGLTVYFVRRGFNIQCKGELEREYSRQKRVFVTISIVLLSHFLCTVVPLVFIMAGVIFKLSTDYFSLVVLVTGFLSGVNASNNIFIYGWKYKEMRRYMGLMLRCEDGSHLQRETSLFFSNARGDVYV
ncbi:unnamed protein product, partial [Mesorhabditis belari]|uniref:G-protein coupled receptors family 1 profile domain-containing protein n=1 Tax=Mesorhabditis belari TaxID=2138241 RepID=A0AAF3F0U8_9BILA